MRAAPVRTRPGCADAGSFRCDPAGGDLRDRGNGSDGYCDRGHVWNQPDVHLQAEEHEEDRGKEVAQRQQKTAGMRRNVA